MARKKKFNDYIGFLWNTADIEKVEVIAKGKDLTSSDIFREAMRLFFAVWEGTATVTYLTPAPVSPVGNIDEKPPGEAAQPESLEIPEAGPDVAPADKSV